MDYLAPYILSIFFSLCLLSVLYKKIFLLYLYAAAIPFFGAFIDFGLQVNAEKIVALMILLLFIGSFKNIKFQKPLLFYILFSIFITTVLSLNLPDYADRLPPMRGRYRWVMQIILLLQLYLPVFYISHIATRKEDILAAIKIFLISTCISAIVGVIQLAIFSASNINILPMGNGLGDVRQSAVAESGLLRITSYSGEPKHFALCLIIAFGLLFICSLLNFRLIKYALGLMILVAVSVVLTSSSQGLILLGILLVVIPIICYRLQKTLTKRLFFITVGVYIVSAIAISQPAINQLLTSRTITRLQEKEGDEAKFGGVEDFDQAILGYLSENPETLILGLGIGNIHLYAYSYIPSIFQYYMTDNVFYSKKGFLRQLTEVGFIGFGLFLYLFIYPLSLIMKKLKKDDRIGILVCAFAIISLFVYLNTCDGPNFCPFALMLLYSYQNILKTEKHLILNK